MSKFKDRYLPYSPSQPINHNFDLSNDENSDIDPPSPIQSMSPIYDGEKWVFPTTDDTDYENVNISAISPPPATSTPVKSPQSPQNSDENPENL